MRNYRDLRVWAKAHELTLAIYKESRVLPREEMFGLTSQMRRASLSIGANLAEGCGRRSEREMARFVQIAMGSAAELSYHLLVARDLCLIEVGKCGRLESAVNEVSRMLSVLSQRLKEHDIKGSQGPRAKGQELRAVSP